ncbi:hypothetical protein SAMN05443549_101993 [Flavobacterium fluvii]|uniref:DoxX-like family protein n=1 Tax=Flavobacterium fluvii TaxID=468056 RepID=A0A1M5FXH7_9FLAO|nr:hypothetical protein [Flavobacterium fluvii]SHF96149.1 hypothetical protein SAMN05443549_101993 [Flavobacterium fluvii]
MNKTDILIGFVIGILASLLGSFLFIKFFTAFDFMEGVESMKFEGRLGKLITLGSILDLVAFGVLLKLDKEMMARGVILAVIVITIITLFA